MPYTCDTEDGNYPVLLITNLETGDSMTGCAECAPIFLASLLEAMTGTTWGPVVATAADPETGDATDEPADANPNPTGDPGPTDPPQTPPDPEPAPPPADHPNPSEHPEDEPTPGAAEPDPDRPGQFMYVGDDADADLADAIVRDAELAAAAGR